jgi:hypothetical protein
MADMPIWAVILAFVMAVPPLSDAQRSRLNTPIDDVGELEDASLYPLLENMLSWEAGDETGARVPDYDALLSQPSVGRGELFLIKGRFAGRARRYELRHTGPWGEALTEWVLLVRDEPEEVAVVYFVDPEGELQAPAVGARVRVVGRLYKVWADTDQAGEPARYMTFVARWPEVAGGQAVRGYDPLLPMLLLVAVLGVVYLLVRRMGRTKPHDSRLARHPTPPSGDDAMLSDPAEALRRMAERDQP